MKSSSTNTSSEAGSLQARIVSLEASNRETLAVLEAKSTAHDNLAEELTAQHQKIVALRKDVATLEDRNQSLENVASTMRFKEQGLNQEINLLKKNVEWLEQELRTRSDESSKFRKEKNARIAELQRSNEEATNTVEASKRTENALRQRIEELSQKAEEAFGKIQKLEESSIESDLSFKTELDSARRLADLHRQSAETARARLQELTENLEQFKDAASEEIGLLQAEVETERTEKEGAETKLAELEIEFERLQAAQVALREQTPPPATPLRNTNGLSAMTPLRAASPRPGTPGTARSKGNLTFTQLYSQVSELTAELEAERRRNVRLTQELDEMVRDLENRGPEQDDFRQDKERMEAEVMEMSNLLNAALADKDNAVNETRKWEGEITGLTNEATVLRQQLRDLSAQIRLLLVEMQARDQGLEALDASSAAQLQLLASSELDEDSSNQTSAGALITQRLLLFRNVSELQEQNVRLLKLNRGLADQMEGDEARARNAEQADKLRELQDLQEKAQRFQDEMRALNTQMESITRERDMFRRMLAHRGPLPGNAEVAESMFGQSIQGDMPPATPRTGRRDMDDSAAGESKQLSEYTKLVKELQSHLDTLRREASTDLGILRQQVDNLAKEKSQLLSDAARSNGQMSLAHERYEMLQSNYKMLQGENTELQKRTQILNENAAKQDLRTQQVAEELMDAKAFAESVRTEIANLKAERELMKTIEGRLSDDNRQLLDERSRLNKMLADLQSLQNEHEQANSDTRRRLQSRIDTLEMEIASVRRRLEAEAEESKKAHLRREYEQEQSKTRIDDLLKSLSETREELVAAKTTRDQLQSRVDEIKIDLRNAEERAQALQPRPSSGGPLLAADGGATTGDGDLTREQELGLEVADLKRDLELAKTELENAKTQVEQYKAISQATEEELQSLNDASDQYREDTDRQLLEKDGVIQQLEQRIEDVNNELSTSNSELSELRTQHEQSGMQLEAQKTSLEGELARLRDECDRQTEKAKLYQQDLKAQAEIAQQAQQSYEDELVKHADAAKSLQAVRVEYNTLRTEVAGIRAEAEAAKGSLSQGQEKWSEMRDQYEKEINEIRTSRNDLKAQNRLLHEQLEAVGTQINSLQQQRTIPEGTTEEQQTTFENTGMKLQEVVTYLRREKEIVDVQHELAMQESKRTKQQLDYVQSQLDETRFKLSEERRQRTDQEANATSHSKLLETINELNLYRESSATLRQESRQAQAKLQEKVKEVEALTEKILPLESRIVEVENELEGKVGELALLQEDRDRWRERTQNIISKYDRVDPAEIEAMKTRISELTEERDQLKEKHDEIAQQITDFPAKLQEAREAEQKNWQETRTKIVEQAKERSRMQGATIKSLTEQVASINELKATLENELAITKNSLEEATVARDDALAQLSSANSAAANGIANTAETEDGQVEDGEVDEAVQTTQTEDVTMQSADEGSKIDALQSEITELRGTVQAQVERIQSLESQVVSIAGNSLISSANTAKAELEQQIATTEQVNEAENGLASAENTSALEAQLEAAREEIATLKATSNSSTAQTTQDGDVEGGGASEDNVAQRVAQQVAQLKAELEAQHELSKKELETEYQTRTTKMKELLNKKLRETRDKIKEDAREELRAELIQQHSLEIQALKEQHEQELDSLKAEHRAFVDRVSKEGAEAVEKARASGAESAQSADPGDSIKVEGAAPDDSQFATLAASLTDAQAKELVTKNEVLRGIVRNNIQKQTAKLKEEHEKDIIAKLDAKGQQLAEEFKKEKEEAVARAAKMEAMKLNIKVNRLEGTVKVSQVKLDVVETAAKDTPQRAVGEVWEIAKSTKPPPAAAATTPSKPAAPAPAPTPAAQPSSPVPAPAAAVAVAAAPAPAEPTAPAPIDTTQPSDEQSRLAARQARFGLPTPTDPSAPADTPATTAPQAGRAALPRPAGSLLPRGGAVAARGGRGGIPQPSGIGRGAPQTSSLPRGGGSVRGRGGAAAASGQRPVSPALNAGAAQFVPGTTGGGAKRPLEGGDNASGDGKRIRGGGPSAP